MLKIVADTTTRKLTTPNFFPDFYGSYDYSTDAKNSSFQLLGLFPTDYETGPVSNNDTYFYGYKSDESFSITSQLSAPLMYILCMLALYLIIISIAFMSALYSHRKRVGYNLDDSIEYLSDESSDENQLLDPELERLNVVDERIQEYDDRSIDNQSIGENELSLNSSSLIKNKKHEISDLNKFSKLEKKKIENFLKNYINKKLQRTKKKSKKRFKKKRHERLSFLFLNKLVKLFPASTLNNQVSTSMNNDVKLYETEMKTTKSYVYPYIENSTTNPKSQLIQTSWNDENEV